MNYFVTCYQPYIVLSIPVHEVMKVKSPLQLASPLSKQQMLATRAAGVVIAHHPPWLVLQPLHRPRHPSVINDFGFCCSSTPIVRFKNKLSRKFW
jgi:hypothetical protein